MYYLMVEKANGSLLLYFHSPVACENSPHTRAIFFLYIGLLEMTQLTRKPPIALRLILRGSQGPTA